MRASAGLAIVALLCWAAPAAGASELLEEIIVVETLGDRLGTAGSVGRVDAEALGEIRPTHIHEALVRIPGVWISRGSGHEHLTAIRSAVLTGAGACGAFLYLEDGLPIRPAGFCNVNNLLEVNAEQAAGIEVWRGPASAALGGNALHGAINVLTPNPAVSSVSVEGGSYGFAQVRAALAASRGNHRIALSANGSHSNGYRDETGYGQQKLSFIHVTDIGSWQVRNTLNATNLNQETGGFVLGRNAYEDGALRRTNPNPEAYRDAWSVRAASHWSNAAWRLSPYVRRSRMVFLQHFLPGQPREANEQTSGGMLASYDFEGRALFGNLGAQLEVMQGSLSEIQRGPTRGSAFLVGTRPPGRHYDYDVGSFMGAFFYDLSWNLGSRTRLMHGLRLEHLTYDYDNNHLLGQYSRRRLAMRLWRMPLYTSPVRRRRLYRGGRPVRHRAGIRRERHRLPDRRHRLSAAAGHRTLPVAARADRSRPEQRTSAVDRGRAEGRGLVRLAVQRTDPGLHFPGGQRVQRERRQDPVIRHRIRCRMDTGRPCLQPGRQLCRAQIRLFPPRRAAARSSKTAT